MANFPLFRQAATVTAAALLAALQGCARQPYTPRSLDTDAAAAAYTARTTEDPSLKQYMVANGHREADWPVQRWGLVELTLLAFYYRPELEVARAEARVARAQADVAAQRLPMIVGPRLEHHSAPGADDTPWSLGLEVAIPLTSGTRREALIERADYVAQAAELSVGAMAWQVRSEVRARLLDVYAARQRNASLEREAQEQQATLGMLERRLAAGYASVTEVDTVRLRLAQAEAELAQGHTDAERSLGRLAEALAVPLARVREMEFAFRVFEELPEPPAWDGAQRTALTNRLDIRRRLLEFSAADAAVKLEVARQYPTFVLRPGYLWDQGDNVWSFALDLVLPATLTHAPAIRAAVAQREAAAQQALQQQAMVIGELDTRLATYDQGREGAHFAAAASVTQMARSAQMQRQFDVGQVDRLELTLTRIEALLVERRAQAARIEAQRALGELENALQAPFSVGPIPVAAGDQREATP
jgi:outer membrane protein TolC